MVESCHDTRRQAQERTTRNQWRFMCVEKSLINDKIIDLLRTIPDRVDVLVAWLTTDTSLIEPSHFSVSVDELLSEHSLLMLPVLLEMLLVLPLRFGVWKSCDQLMARDCSSWLSWRNLYSVCILRTDGDGDGEKSVHQKPLIIIIYSLFMYVFCHERRQSNIRRNIKMKKTFKKSFEADGWRDEQRSLFAHSVSLHLCVRFQERTPWSNIDDDR